MSHPDAAAQPSSVPVPPEPGTDARAAVARRTLAAAALLGVLGDALLRHDPWGIGLLLWMLGLGAGVAALAHRAGRQLSREGMAWLVLAVWCGGAMTWRDAAMLQVFDLFGMLAALTLLAMSISRVPAPAISRATIGDLVVAAAGTGLGVATGAIPLLLNDAQLDAPSGGRARRVGRAVVIAAPVVLVFALLLSSADPVFAKWLTLPGVDLDEVLSHVLIAGFFTWVVAGWARRSLQGRPAMDGWRSAPFPLSLASTDVSVGLGALNALFAAFVLAQLGWLFGGEDLVVRTTGLTYAQYARRGFFELIAVAGLLLPVLLVSRTLVGENDARATQAWRRLAIPLVVLLGAILASAAARMTLYVRFYGISADRLYATAVMGWLVFVFAWLAWTVLRSRPRYFAAGLVISGYVVLATLHLVNPDALVARTNLSRAVIVGAGVAGPDPRYIATLGADAASVLVSALTTPGHSLATAPVADRCAAAATLLDKWTGTGYDRRFGHWSQWNIARSRARAMVAEREVALRELACPATGQSDGGP